LFTFETARSETPDNLWEITFRLTERIIFVSRGITVYYQRRGRRGMDEIDRGIF
jgi:hypothetical protein